MSRIDGSRFRRLRVAGLPTNADVGPCIWAGNRALLCEVRSQAGSVDGIYQVDPSDLQAPVRLTATPYPPGVDFGGGDIPGDVSPDGTRFVFLRSIPVAPPTNPEATQSGALFVANIDGSKPHRITAWGVPNSHDSGFESWGSRSRGIVFGTEAGDLATIDADGSRLHYLHAKFPPNSYAYAPSWSPTGEAIVFGMYAAPTFQSDIYIVDLRSGCLRQLTNTPTFDDTPDWASTDPSSATR